MIIMFNMKNLKFWFVQLLVITYQILKMLLQIRVDNIINLLKY